MQATRARARRAVILRKRSLTIPLPTSGYTRPCHFRRMVLSNGCYAENFPNSLTQQPFLPKLSLIKYMRNSSLKLQLFTLLLLLAFLGAQLHFCADLTDAASTSHPCPFCSANDLVAPATPMLSVGPTSAQRIEQRSTFAPFSSAFSLVLSLRAPPAANLQRA